MPRRGLIAVVATAGAVVAATAAPAQTTEPVSISLKLSPKVQLADFDRTVTISGQITGSPTLTTALAERSVELEVEAIAEGYERPFDLEPIRPKADGTFSRRIDVAVNARITLRTTEGGPFIGQSPTVTARWRPVPEVSNYTRGRKLVMEYRVNVPGGIPFSTGSLRIRRGTAKKAVFYAGPKKSIPRLGSAKLESDYDGEVHATLAYPFRKLPPGGGRIYACVKGTPFLGFEPLDRKCGAKRSTRKIPAPPT